LITNGISQNTISHHPLLLRSFHRQRQSCDDDDQNEGAGEDCTQAHRRAAGHQSARPAVHHRGHGSAEQDREENEVDDLDSEYDRDEQPELCAIDAALKAEEIAAPIHLMPPQK
jgi:hypothetical protein